MGVFSDGLGVSIPADINANKKQERFTIIENGKDITDCYKDATVEINVNDHTYSIKLTTDKTIYREF